MKSEESMGGRDQKVRSPCTNEDVKGPYLCQVGTQLFSGTREVSAQDASASVP